jgi:hypothetical protein
MGKKGKGRKGGKRKGDTIRYPFKFTYQPLAATTNGFSGTYIDLSCANLGTRISVVCKQFRRWRFCRGLKVMQYMDSVGMASITYDVTVEESNAVCMSHALGFFGGPESSLSAVPSNLNTIVELVCSNIGPSGKILRLNVPLKILNEAMIEPWHFTTDGGTLPFATATTIGNLQFGTSVNVSFVTGSANVYVVISGEIEFAEPIEPAISMNSWKPKLVPVFNMPCFPDPYQKSNHSKVVEVVSDEKSESATEFVTVPNEPVGQVSPTQTAMFLLLDKIVADVGLNEVKYYLMGRTGVAPAAITIPPGRVPVISKSSDVP